VRAAANERTADLRDVIHTHEYIIIYIMVEEFCQNVQISYISLNLTIKCIMHIWMSAHICGAERVIQRMLCVCMCVCV